MMDFVACVENSGVTFGQLTFVNTKNAKWQGIKQPSGDFGIRRELCNFAADFQLYA